MPEENGVTDIWDTQGEKMWTKDIISGVKLTFKYEGYRHYQHAGTQELLFPWSLPEEFGKEWASDNQDDDRPVNIGLVASIKKTVTCGTEIQWGLKGRE